MKIVKFVMMALGVVGVALSFVYKLPSYGTQGMIVIGACALPVLLGLIGTVVTDGIPRWASVISAIAFLVAAMKTTSGDEFQNIMIASAVGLLLAVALVIRPDRRRAAA